VEQGSEFALMVENKPHVLEGDSRKFEDYAGGKATVTGLVTLNRIEVHRVSNTKQTEADAHIGEQKTLRAEASR
jgi:hypothetical protein